MERSSSYSNSYISYSGAKTVKVSAKATEFGEVNLSLDSTAFLHDFDKKEEVAFNHYSCLNLTYEQAKEIIGALSELVDSHEEAIALAQFDSQQDMEEVEI
jgi:hypothetical protein